MGKTRTKKGSTLRKLSKKYGVKGKTLRELNPDMKGQWGKKGKKKLDKDTMIRLGKGVGIAPWRAELLEDPTYAAFDRNFEFNRDSVHDSFQRLKDRQRIDLTRQDARFDKQRIDNTRQIDRGMEDRGLYRSGQRGIETGRMNNDIDVSRREFTGQQKDARIAGRQAKQEALGALKRNRAEERIGARSRLTERDAQTKYGF